jgi:iron complex outermembrane receptor protein
MTGKIIADSKRSIGNLQADYKLHFLPDLHANLNLGYDISEGTGTIFVSDSSSLEYSTGDKIISINKRKRIM